MPPVVVLPPPVPWPAVPLEVPALHPASKALPERATRPAARNAVRRSQLTQSVVEVMGVMAVILPTVAVSGL
ncbi:hypothetical protein MLP_14090 [Microlunatus phosphovorus NM-1]|uniref:Uncharacterized protein n=1 Tax=Microlunatus phosphovorus (strain ATCC 700054 / DSM 10555 / JCM 9379 / NBRC 101784 / NCIMB 13414 / VKM Ac-1990 / NM-1) TaxID=1032480 RepID=F5XQC3_MICPN|nr:hypothetical protein MLP_14090 [Microlunatus phosphovorus NM-1]